MPPPMLFDWRPECFCTVTRVCRKMADEGVASEIGEVHCPGSPVQIIDHEPAGRTDGRSRHVDGKCMHWRGERNDHVF